MKSHRNKTCDQVPYSQTTLFKTRNNNCQNTYIRLRRECYKKCQLYCVYEFVTCVNNTDYNYYSQHVMWGTQEPLWPVSKSVPEANARVKYLSKPKKNFQQDNVRYVLIYNYALHLCVRSLDLSFLSTNILFDFVTLLMVWDHLFFLLLYLLCLYVVYIKIKHQNLMIKIL